MTTTYDRKKVNYRQIWKENFGPIPKDELGRTYHIHHRDGNHDNNSLDNLQCVSMQEHYDIHRRQGDWAACIRLARNLNRSQEEISEIARLANLKQVTAGTHPFLGGELQRKNARELNRKRVANGTHHWLGGETNQKRVADGTHNFLGDKNPIHQRIATGSHNIKGENNPMWGKSHSSLSIAKIRSSQPKATPIICNQTGVEYRSQMEAARSLGLKQSDIANVLGGRQRSTKGYSFSYAEK